jgi:uncharacterized membrane protein
VAGSDGAWHETLASEVPVQGSSNRAFGYVFTGLFAFLGITGLWHGQASAYWWLLAALAVFLLARFAAPLLSPLNRIWLRFGLALSRVMNPVLLAVMFFGVVLPTSILLRLARKDPLRLRIDKSATSYWIGRDTPITSMTKQY